MGETDRSMLAVAMIWRRAVIMPSSFAIWMAVLSGEMGWRWVKYLSDVELGGFADIGVGVERGREQIRQRLEVHRG